MRRAPSPVTLIMPFLTISHLAKSYEGTHALRDVELTLHAGEVHALMGENGAGKSTLIRVLAGVSPADAMRLDIDGQERPLRSPEDAAALGFRFVHQELNIVPRLSVAENIFLGKPYPRTRLGRIDWRALHAAARAALSRLGAEGIDTTRRASQLRTGEQMMMKLAGMLVGDEATPRLFVLDEPTAALTRPEADRLFCVIADLKRAGAAILYVSHRLEEVMELCDRVTVLRDGKVVQTCPIAETSRDGIIQAMTARDLATPFPPRTPRPEDRSICRARNATTARVQGLDFDLRAGEVLGLAGLENAGQAHVLSLLLGDERLTGGSIELADAPLPKGPARAWRRGVAYVPRERRREALMLRRDITANTVLSHLGRFGRWRLFADARRERRAAADLAAKVRLKYHRLGQTVATLSGGNQQKVVLARAIAGSPELLLLDEPTRGVDIGARADIYAVVRDLSAKGTAIVMSSSDLPELLGLCDRILILHEGRQIAILPAEGRTPTDLLSAIYAAAPGRTRP
jgi:ribose transport system ATP-binding protein